MNKLTKTMLVVAVSLGAMGAASAGGHHYRHFANDGWCGHTYHQDCPYNDGGYCDGRGMGPGMGMGRGMGPGMGMGPGADGFCYRHRMPLAECMGMETYEQFKADYDAIDKMKNELFVKRQVLRSMVRAGDDPDKVAAAAEDFNKTRDAIRAARYALDQKVRDHYEKMAQEVDAKKAK